MPTRRRLLEAAALAGLSSLAARAGRSADLSRLTLRAGVFLGQDETLLHGTGLDRTPYTVDYAEFNAGNLITQAVDAGAIDYGTWSEIPLVFAAASRARLKVIATVEGPTSDQAVLVPSGSPARSIADLRGKRVGYIRATTTHYFLLKMLARHGLSFSDIQPVALSMTAGRTAMSASALDAWATYGYAIPMLQTDGRVRILETAAGILSGNYLMGANARQLGDPDFRVMLADYIGRVARAYAILSLDKPRWAKLVAPIVNVPEPLVLTYLRDFNRPFVIRAIRPSDIASAQDVADTFARNNLLPRGIEVADYFSHALTPLLRAA